MMSPCKTLVVVLLSLMPFLISEICNPPPPNNFPIICLVPNINHPFDPTYIYTVETLLSVLQIISFERKPLLTTHFSYVTEACYKIMFF